MVCLILFQIMTVTKPIIEIVNVVASATIDQKLDLVDVEDISDVKAVKLGKILLRGDNIIAIPIPEN